MFPHFRKYLNPQVTTKKLVNSVFLTPLSSKISLRDTSFHVSLNSLRLSLKNACWIFSDLYIFTFVGKKISIYDVHISIKCIESMHFYSSPSPPLKTPGRISWKSCFLTEGVEETMIFSTKIRSENMKMNWNIEFIYILYDL